MTKEPKKDPITENTKDDCITKDPKEIPITEDPKENQSEHLAFQGPHDFCAAKKSFWLFSDSVW